ncbi:MAG TPA: hypothetical protein VHC69_02550 [Polyangiaceae bacterium]|nr:hypothetical protein [Polyangiaceae bacterium]
MTRRASLSLSLLTLALSLVAFDARAWVERTVKSDSVTVDLERDGTAVVTHEILLGVRGGPLPEFAVEPVDADAELLEGATVTRAESGRAAGLPLPLSLTKNGTRISMRVIGLKGLHGGTHQIRFSYRTNLEAAGKLEPNRASTTVEWTGPSFADGIDSARVLFRVPRGGTPPRLSSARPGGDAVTITDDADGVFLGTFRRAMDKDELEVVRPHMAKGEAVSWRITVDAATFDLRAEPKSEEPVLAPEVPAKAGAPKALPDERPLFGSVAAVAVLLALVVVLKSRWVDAACRLRGARARPLVPLAAPLRALFAGACAFAAVFVALGATEPFGAAALLLASMASSTHLPPRLSPLLRGPGKWVRLEPETAFEDPRAEKRLPGRLLDAGTVPGFLLFAALLSSFVAGALAVARKSPYEGLWVALASAILFPIFCTGTAGELPFGKASEELLEWLMNALDGARSIEAYPLARVPQGAEERDEIRLLVLPKPALPGFVALEAGVDYHQGVLGFMPLPYVLVRVIENSVAADALPKGLLWTRGRSAEERVAVLRPKLPTRKVTLELVKRLVERLTAAATPEQRQRGKTSAARSSGSGLSTANAGTTSSPVHAT